MVFIGLGLCAVGPITHMVVSTHGFHELMRDVGFGWIVLSGAMYIFGATL